MTKGVPCTGTVTEETPPLAVFALARPAASTGVALYKFCTTNFGTNARLVTACNSLPRAPEGTIPEPTSGIGYLLDSGYRGDYAWVHGKDDGTRTDSSVRVRAVRRHVRDARPSHTV